MKGRLAQLVERFIYTEDVGGSSPSSSTMSIFRTLLRFAKTFFASYNDPDLKGLIEIVTVLFLIATVFYHYFEGWSYFDSLYFSVTTLFTVGLGDFYPKTLPGKVFTIFYIIVGVAAFLGFVNLYIVHHQKSVVHEEDKKLPN